MITESRAWEARPHRRPPPRRNSAGFSRMIQLTARRSTKARIARVADAELGSSKAPRSMRTFVTVSSISPLAGI